MKVNFVPVILLLAATIASAAPPEAIQRFTLDERVVVTVPVSTNRVTTISFPGPIAAIDAVGVEHGGRFGAVFRAEAFLLSRYGVFDVEGAAELAAIENEPTFHRLRFFVRRYETARGRGCIRYTRRAANPVISSDCRVIPVR